MNTEQALLKKNDVSKWFNMDVFNNMIKDGWTDTGLRRTYLFK